MAACQANSAEARDLALEASPLYGPLAELARDGFTGTVAELHVGELPLSKHQVNLTRRARGIEG